MAVGVSVRGQTADGGTGATCGYLPANRFDWWTAVRPPDDETAFSLGAIIQEPDDSEGAFLAEFCPILATVVGSGVPTPGMAAAAPPFQTVSWDALDDGDSPNRLPGAQFTFVTKRPNSIPVMITRTITDGTLNPTATPASRSRERKIVANGIEAEAGFPLVRELQIVFHQPQRGQSLTRYALLGNAGPTPLVVRRLRVEDPNSTFYLYDTHLVWPVPPDMHLSQLAPGEFLDVPVTFRPVAVGPFSAALVAETNAGEEAVSLVGEAVSP
jgi:hypothetical protein